MSLNVRLFKFSSNPRTFPKLCRNCRTIKQSEKVLPDKTRPWTRDSSGRHWTETRVTETVLFQFDIKSWFFFFQVFFFYILKVRIDAVHSTELLARITVSTWWQYCNSYLFSQSDVFSNIQSTQCSEKN